VAGEVDAMVIAAHPDDAGVNMIQEREEQASQALDIVALLCDHGASTDIGRLDEKLLRDAILSPDHPTIREMPEYNTLLALLGLSGPE